MDKKLVAAFEGILFAVGDNGITVKELMDILSKDESTIQGLILVITQELEQNENRGLRLKFVGGRYMLATKPENYEYYTKLANKVLIQKLTQSAMETLAVVAYKQPVTKGEIETIRGVNSDTMIEKLKQKNLIEETGRSNAPGRPYLYSVTKTFFEKFNLSSIADLPKLTDIVRKDEIDENGFQKKELFDSMREVNTQEIINTMIELDK